MKTRSEGLRKVEKRDAKGYHRVQVVNDWGAYGYFMWVWESGFGTRGLQGQEPEAALKPGERVRLRGDDAVYVIVGEAVTEYVSEQGIATPYAVTSNRLYLSDGDGWKLPLENQWVKRVQA